MFAAAKTERVGLSAIVGGNYSRVITARSACKCGGSDRKCGASDCAGSREAVVAPGGDLRLLDVFRESDHALPSAVGDGGSGGNAAAGTTG